MKDSLVIILYDHPWEHTSDYARQTSEHLRKNNVVIALLLKDTKSIKEAASDFSSAWFWKKQNKNYYLCKPLYFIPFKRFHWIEHTNLVLTVTSIKLFALWLSWKRRIKKTYVWVFNPEHFSIVKLFGTAPFIIYDCVDYHGEEQYTAEETLLIKTSNLVCVNSRVLYKLHRKIRNNIYLVPLGFDLNRFRRKKNEPIIQVLHGQPVIGYVGGINSRLDFRLLVPLIRKNPQYTFVFVGPIQQQETLERFQISVKPKIDTLIQLPNVQYFPFLPKQVIPQMIQRFDIGMIPYDCTRKYNSYSFPMKLFEYFYMEKPVLATPVEELKRFPKYVQIGTKVSEWEKHITDLLSHKRSDFYKKKQRALATANSWEKKIVSISDIVERNRF